MTDPASFAAGPGEHKLIAGAPQGVDAQVLAAAADGGRTVVFVARDDRHMARMAVALAFFAPKVNCVEFPAWDCLPYDRVSPRDDIVSRRLDALSRLHGNAGGIVLTTISAALQRVPARDVVRQAVRTLTVGERIDPEDLMRFLDRNGYRRAGTVMEPGEMAVRGGIVDVFPAGAANPSRLDFFGDEVEAIRPFDAATQRRLQGEETKIVLKPVSEVILDEDAVSRFRSAYRILFGAGGSDDPLYEAVTAGQRHVGMEHWLALFHEKLETIFDYLPGAVIFLDHQLDEARQSRLDLINEYYQARADMAAGTGRDNPDAATLYRPVPPDRLYLDETAWNAALERTGVAHFSPFAPPPGGQAVDAGGKAGRDFAEVRVRPDANVYEALRLHAEGAAEAGQRLVVAAFTEGSRDRLASVFAEHGMEHTAAVSDAESLSQLNRRQIGLAVLGLDKGFETPDLAVITEQDLLGHRLSQPGRRKVRAENFIAETTSLGEGDLVVHIDHGIGRFDGLETISVGGAPHECLRLVYAGEDKLFLPVENIELLSRFGSEQSDAQLDRLGGAGWQARKARLKERVREMAGELIKVAAARALKQAPAVRTAAGLYDEFCARFPFTETEDQSRAITDVLGDLAAGRPADRLVCGDVGFGKTEVALRAAFAVAMEGKQVAIVVPTTLLCRQHFQVFADRFAGFPVQVEQMSRLVTPARIKEIKGELEKGTVDIVIGTHALLAKDVRFRDLGLLIIDEEQHFGVAHKERLKTLKADVHVLTLTATPIPRTLQMALTGLREMSLMATPPVDRLAVRTFVLPYDPVVIREAILRERHRGGQTFYVCPRVADLPRVEARLKDLVPEARVATAHGRLASKDLEETVSQFYDGSFDVLLSTNIIESGLDLPTVNTIIIHRADMFGLSQLYQLRGRVGRSKVRAYAYLTLPPGQRLTKTAEKRLEVMQTLDTLGAGFTLASHDLDIRGAGNLLGDEQSGHIREVGVELYQHMLEEAVAEARGLNGQGEAGQGGPGSVDDDWSPQISVGLPVLIPDSYVSDLTVRMGLYRRLAWVAGQEEIDAFAAELIDRFGPLPDEAENLLRTVALKAECKRAGVEKIEAGPKGAVVSFRRDDFANPEGLVEFLTSQKGTAKLRPDHKLVFMRSWETPAERLEGTRYLTAELARIAAA